MANWLDRLSPNMLRLVMNIWPPFRSSGIKVVAISSDYLSSRVILKQRLLNRNYVGTHFGGSMFSMTDPFFMLMLLKNLGKQYIVWDKAAKIDFIKPGKGTLTAHFSLTLDEIQQIREVVNREQKYLLEKNILIKNEMDEVVASVTKVLYVRLKRS